MREGAAGEPFFDRLGLRVSDPLRPILDTCLGLARAQTHSGALEWFCLPVIELNGWIEAVNALNKQRQ